MVLLARSSDEFQKMHSTFGETSQKINWVRLAYS